MICGFEIPKAREVWEMIETLKGSKALGVCLQMAQTGEAQYDVAKRVAQLTDWSMRVISGMGIVGYEIDDDLAGNVWVHVKYDDGNVVDWDLSWVVD